MRLKGFKNKSKEKSYSYKPFAEWIKSKKHKKVLIIVIALICIISFTPIIWLFHKKAGNIITVDLDWMDTLLFGTDIPVTDGGYAVRLYEDDVYISGQMCTSGTVTFFANSLTASYQVRIYQYQLDANPDLHEIIVDVVDLDLDGVFDLVEIDLVPLTIASQIRWDRPDNLEIISQDFDLLMYNGISWDIIGTVTTDAFGFVNFEVIGGEFMLQGQITPSIINDNLMHYSTYTDTILIEPIVMLISSIVIILILIIGMKEPIIFANKSVRSLKKTKGYDIAIEYGVLITNNTKIVN